jgi:hypothetical protein
MMPQPKGLTGKTRCGTGRRVVMDLLEDAYNNILAQDHMAARGKEEEKQLVMLRGHPEPPDGETQAERTRHLWILRALQQTSCVSHMAWEICGDSTKTYWSAHLYQEYRRLLDSETMAVCRIHAEIKLADLLVREGKKAK